MDVDCMMLEDVELDPELPPSSGGNGGLEGLHVASCTRSDSTAPHPSCLRFQTIVNTGTPSALWLHAAETSSESAGMKAEWKRSGSYVFDIGVERIPSGDAGADTRSSVSGPCSSGPPAAGKEPPSSYRSIVSFCVEGSKPPAVTTVRGDTDTARSQGVCSAEPSKHSRLRGFLTFVLCGVSSLCCWQFLLSLMPYIENTFFNGTPVGNSLMGVYQVGCISVQLVLMFLVESMRPRVVTAAIALDAALALLFPLVVASGSRKMKMVLTHLLALCFGANAGVICGCCLAVASALPYNFIGAFSAGQGIAGVASFVIGLAFKSLFNLASVSGLSQLLWLVYGISCGVSIISACLLLVALQQPWASRRLTLYWEAQRRRSRERRWTVMWRRWVGPPKKARSAQMTLAVGTGITQVCAAAPVYVTREHPSRPRTRESEDACAGARLCTGCTQHEAGKNTSNRNLDEPTSASAAAACATHCSTAVVTEAGVESHDRICSHPQNQQPVSGTEDTRDNAASTSAREGVGCALDDSEGNRAHDAPLCETEGAGAPPFHKTPMAITTNGASKSDLRQEKAFTERQGFARIPQRSKGAQDCVPLSVPTDQEKHEPSRGWRFMLHDSGTYLICVFLNFFVTLNVYPRVGPIMWQYPSFAEGSSQYIVLFGVFCLGDFLGKCMVDISKCSSKLSWMMIPQKFLLPVVVARFGLAGFFLLGAYTPTHWIFHSFALYVIEMLFLSITNGWCATTSLLYVCSSVERLEEREVLGPASVLVMQLGIMAGVFTALAYPAP